MPVPIDLFRPDLGGANGGSDGFYSRPPRVERQEEREAERRCDEAVGQARSEQEAMQELVPKGTNARSPTPTEGAANQGEESLSPGDEPPRTTGSF